MVCSRSTGSISFVTTIVLHDLRPDAFKQEHPLDRLPAGTRIKVVVGGHWPTSRFGYELDALRRLGHRFVIQVDATPDVIAAWALALGSAGEAL